MKRLSGIKGLIFDMDGTLTVPCLDFSIIRKELDIPSGDIVEAIKKRDPKRREADWALIERHEEAAVAAMRFQPGAENALLNFKNRGIRLALLTRNSQNSVNAVIKKLSVAFDIVLTREFPFIKPHPEPVLHILREWSFEPSQVIVIGDFIHDIASAKAAGAYSCFFENPGAVSYADSADFSVRNYAELEELLGSCGC